MRCVGSESESDLQESKYSAPLGNLCVFLHIGGLELDADPSDFDNLRDWPDRRMTPQRRRTAKQLPDVL